MQITIDTCDECPYHKDTNCEQLNLKKVIEYIRNDNKYMRSNNKHFPNWCPLEIVKVAE